MNNVAVKDITIDLQDKNAGDTDADRGDKIYWKNTTSNPIVLNPPSNVAPHNAETILAGATGIKHTVNQNANGASDYTFNVGAASSLRTGRIIV